MTHRFRINCINSIGLLAAIFVVLTQLPAASAQQDYVGRYDLYTGFSDLYTPGLNKINQKGFHLQAGINNNRWLSTGFDYSIQTGNTSLIPGFASPAIVAGITQLYEEYALTEGQAGLPPTYAVNVPLSATTQTFTAGSQLNYRHFSKMTLFIRPSLAAFRLNATRASPRQHPGPHRRRRARAGQCPPAQRHHHRLDRSLRRRRRRRVRHHQALRHPRPDGRRLEPPLQLCRRQRRLVLSLLHRTLLPLRPQRRRPHGKK